MPEEKLDKLEKLEKTDESSKSEKKNLFNPKVFIIGLPLFIVQLVAVYFITANIILSEKKPNDNVMQNDKKENVQIKNNSDTSKATENMTSFGKNIFNLEDIIVNPAGTNAQRLMLVSIGLDMKRPEDLTTLREKDVLLKDAVISLLSTKTLDKLNEIGYKDTLRVELSKIISQRIPEVQVNQVYFSKYIIQ